MHCLLEQELNRWDYRTRVFVAYTCSETHDEFAIPFLLAHRDTRLMTITIGETICSSFESIAQPLHRQLGNYRLGSGAKTSPDC
jgi:hypothetical protein